MPNIYRLKIGAFGETTVKVDEPEPGSSAGSGVILAHGMHNNLDFPLLEITARHLASLGHTAVRFNFLYREAGRDRPDHPDQLVACLKEVYEDSRKRWALNPDGLFIGGKSLGAITSARAAGLGLAVRGLIFLGFPLHRPNSPDQARIEELKAVQGKPRLFVEGTRDPLCDLNALKAVLAKLPGPVKLHEVPGGDHAFLPPAGDSRTAAEIYAGIAEAVGQWIQAHLETDK